MSADNVEEVESLLLRNNDTPSTPNNTQLLTNNHIVQDKVTPNVSPTHKGNLRRPLLATQMFCARQKYNISLCPETRHCIDLTESIPVRIRSYRYSWSNHKLIKEETDNWLELGFVWKSQSPYASPVFVLDQLFHSSTPRRLVTYSRGLNGTTIKRAYSIPHIDDTIDRVGKRTLFSAMDIKKEYQNINIIRSA